MTDKEIIKALECCVNWGSTTSCADCPLCNTGCVHFSKLKETLDLINRQQAENKELKTENLILSQKRFNIFERIEFTDKLKKQAKTEAIKEFAELVDKDIEEKLSDSIKEQNPHLHLIHQIVKDRLKEMAGEDK